MSHHSKLYRPTLVAAALLTTACFDTPDSITGPPTDDSNVPPASHAEASQQDGDTIIVDNYFPRFTVTVHAESAFVPDKPIRLRLEGIAA